MNNIHNRQDPVTVYQDEVNDDSWKEVMSLKVFSKPKVLPESAWTEHIPFAFWLMDVLKPSVFVELGTHYGLSYFAFCQAVMDDGFQTKCYAIDTWKGDEHAGFYDDSVYEFVKNTNQAYESFSSICRSTFDDAVASFEDKSIDLLHIDGLHTYEAVKHDFFCWLPKISEKGIVIFHDTNVKENGFRVYQLWDELKQVYPHFEFKHGFGLGLLCVGQRIPAAFKRFIEIGTNDEAAKSIYQVYERLGMLCGIEKGLENAGKQLLFEKSNSVKLQTAFEDSRLEVAYLKSLADNQKAEYEQGLENAGKQLLLEKNNSVKLKMAFDDSQLEIAHLKSLTDGQKAVYEQAKKLFVSEKNALNKQVSSEKMRADGLSIELNSVSAKLATANSALVQLSEELFEIKAIANVFTKEIQQLKNSLNIANTDITHYIQQYTKLEEDYLNLSNRSERTGKELKEAKSGLQEYRQALEELKRVFEIEKDLAESKRQDSQIKFDLLNNTYNKDILGYELEILAVRKELQNSIQMLSNSENLLLRNKASHESVVVAMQKKINSHEADLNSKQNELNYIRNTKWWKIYNYLNMHDSVISKSQAGSLIKKTAKLIKWTVTFKLNDKLAERKQVKRRDKDLLKIRESNLFDVAWYYEHYPDVKNSNIDPILHYLQYGVIEGRNPNQFFDTLWYLRRYNDVAESGINPLVHFIEIGAIEKREPHPNYNHSDFQGDIVEINNYGINPIAQMLWKQTKQGNGAVVSNKQQSQQPVQVNYTSTVKNAFDFKNNETEFRAFISPLKFSRVVYVTGFPNSASHKFRVYDQVLSLNQAGITASWIDASEISDFLHLLTFAEVVVLFRVAHEPILEKVVNACKKAGVLIVYDTDDFIFNPDIANEKNVDGIRFLSDRDKASYYKDILRYRDAMKLCEVGIFTTQVLADAGKELGLKTFVIKNGVSEKLIRLSENALARANKPAQEIVIVYASGSLTHQKDFTVAVPALVKLLAEFDHLKLKIIGRLNMDEFPDLKAFRNQIELSPFIPLDQLPNEMAMCDINIAPLEVGNPFCEAKSELKYFDAAILNIPTVASATATYKMAINNGENGFTVLTDEDWYEALFTLITDKNARREIGQRAHAHALANYGIASKRNEVLNVFNYLFKTRRNRFLNDKGKQFNQTITIMTCGMDKGSGGHAIIIDMAKWLAKSGHTILINFSAASFDYASPESIETEFGFDTSSMRANFNKDVPADSNVVFATFWSTVYDIEKTDKLIGRRYYMLLDYEPYFYPMSTEYILSLNTYFKDFNRISWGPWIKNLLLNRHKIDNTRVFPLYYNKKIYNLHKGQKRSNNKIVFFGRPAMPRRCFDLGVQILTRYRELYGDHTEIVFFGSLAIANMNLPFKHTNLGVLTPAQLANLYNIATLGIVFSPTNPSKAPFEMMACGLPVMDLDVEGNEANYGSRDNVFLVQPDPDTMARQINSILKDDSKRNLVAANGEEFVARFPDEEEAAHKLFEILNFDASTTL